MVISKREPEAVLNLLGSLQGTAWKLVENYDIEKCDETGAFGEILKLLDAAFQYDPRVELPSDFNSYFNALQRAPGQTILQYITEHDDRLRRLDRHGINLPSEVQGWHLLHKANVTREQRQLVMSQAPKLTRTSVQEALFTILGQDYKSVAVRHDRPHHFKQKGRAYVAADDPDEEDWPEEEEGYFEYDDDASPLDDVPEEEVMFDAEAGYYQHDPSAPDTELQEFDVQEYDEAFATYVDARRRFQDLKLSRGFLPVVALSEAGASSSSYQQPGQHGGGKPGGGFQKGRGKKGNGKNIVRYKSSPGKGVNPKGRAKAAMTDVCVRCGAEGHKAINCPKQKTSIPTSSNKRQAVESVAMHGDEKEVSMVLFEDQFGRERPDCAMIDPGASAVLMGYGPFVRYIQHLKQLGFEVEKIEIYKCHRTFHFGGDNSSVGKYAVKLPVFVGGQYGLLQSYLLKGETPLLLGRPIAQSLGLKLDLQEMKIKVGSSSWRPILLGLHGEYLLPLTEDYSDEYNLDEPSLIWCQLSSWKLRRLKSSISMSLSPWRT